MTDTPYFSVLVSYFDLYLSYDGLFKRLVIFFDSLWSGSHFFKISVERLKF